MPISRKMRRLIKRTRDGSPTIFIPELNEHYHSVYGAIAESEHVFIENGLKRIAKRNLSVFEIGFGTGLNAWLTCIAAEKDKKKVLYHTIEISPLNKEEWQEYEKYLAGSAGNPLFRHVNGCPWGKEVIISSWFRIKKIKDDIARHNIKGTYDVIYFDAFGPDIQPEIWTKEIFSKISAVMNAGAVLTTYSAKGEVRRNLQAAGLKVERIPGPPGKRQMLLAFKPFQ